MEKKPKGGPTKRTDLILQTLKQNAKSGETTFTYVNEMTLVSAATGGY
jgi:hypothetical protein